jgi:hypothetical protein
MFWMYSLTLLTSDDATREIMLSEHGGVRRPVAPLDVETGSSTVWIDVSS